MIRRARAGVPGNRSLLVAISGIDGSGKGYITGQMAQVLQEQGIRVAAINIDGWLNLLLPKVRPESPARHFYEHGIRFEEMFDRLILPLRTGAHVNLVAQLTDATNSEAYRQHTYEFENVDVILLEGIFLLKKIYREYFDLSFWIDCTFETALERALARDQEGLPREVLIRDYESIYFPAERIHLSEDNPRAFATAILSNDPKLPANPT